ncbi:MAG: ABC transporter ATP-binding protein [Actinomycetota bacterium]|nr:ABC transporter ATP-binding protein [Actinomycetota bacterium]
MASSAIHIDGLTKRFGTFTALDRLTLDVAVGEVFGFLGPNGAGKSTTLRLLLGLIRPTAGSATIMGIDVGNVRAAHRHLAFVPGDVNLWPKLTGGECLELLANFHGDVDRAYRAALVERFQLDLAKKARTYSKGNRQKVALVAAFATRAEVLLLDEPTSGLDPLMEKEFRSCVSEAAGRGQTVLLSSHLLAEVESLCARVGILREGRLVEVAPIDQLRALRKSELEIDFEGAPPDLRSVSGVAQITTTPAGVRLTLNGPPGPVLQAIAASNVTGIRSQEASLEEIFLTYYGSDGRGRGASGSN